MLRMNRADEVERRRSLAVPRAMDPARTGRAIFLAALLATGIGTVPSACVAERIVEATFAVAEPEQAVSPIAEADRAAPTVAEPDQAAAAAATEPAEAASPAAAAEPAAAPADRVTLGVDLVSRDVWRGQVYGDAPCFQPWTGVSLAGFTLSAWGSFAFAPVASDTAGGNTEVDVSLARSRELPIGTITATLTDYHFPSGGISYFEFADDSTGSHTVEARVAYRGPDGLPLGLCGSVNVYNDDEHAAYVEASWPFTAGATEINLVAGAALGKSIWYDVDKNGVHFIQAAVSTSKPLKISDAFAPTLKVSWILNPYKGRVILVAALSL